MAEETRLTLVILAVEELRRAVAFYRAAFGWPQTVDEAVYAEFALPGAVRLGLYSHAGFARNAGQAPLKPARGEITGAEIYLFVDDLSAAIARVEAAGGARSVHARCAIGATRPSTSPIPTATWWSWPRHMRSMRPFQNHRAQATESLLRRLFRRRTGRPWLNT
jgi:predicted enzyme related to lactoylglutathione lyase